MCGSGSSVWTTGSRGGGLTGLNDCLLFRVGRIKQVKKHVGAKTCSLLHPSRVGDAAAWPQGALLVQHWLLLQLPRSGPWVCETGSDPMKKSIVALLRALPLGSSFSPDASLHIHISYFSFMFLQQTRTPTFELSAVTSQNEQTSVNNGN